MAHESCDACCQFLRDFRRVIDTIDQRPFKGEATMCLGNVFMTVFVFFFQAEDGIRDGTVTGVQTCALPILTARSLVRLGFEVRTAATGGEGIELARRLRPSLILLDINLPDVTGWDVLTVLDRKSVV